MERIRDLATVSSLYGPGAVAGWLCSIVSVLTPWLLTSWDQQKSRISNDLIAALALPFIAVIHMTYQLSNVLEPIDSPSSPGIEAPLVICETFLVVAPLLLSTAVFCSGPAQSIAIGSTLSSIIVLEIMHEGSLRTLRSPIFEWSVVALGSVQVLPLLVLLLRPSITAALPNHHANQRLYTIVCVVPNLFLYVFIAALRARRLSPLDLSEFNRVFFITKTNYHINDLDQAVAFGAGIVTIIVSLYTAISERVPARMRTWGQFEDWRRSRADFIEANGVDERLSDRLKEHLQRLDEKVKGLLEAPERRILDKAWRRSKRRKGEDAERVIELLKDSGFL